MLVYQLFHTSGRRVDVMLRLWRFYQLWFFNTKKQFMVCIFKREIGSNCFNDFFTFLLEVLTEFIQRLPRWILVNLVAGGLLSSEFAPTEFAPTWTQPAIKCVTLIFLLWLPRKIDNIVGIMKQNHTKHVYFSFFNALKVTD